MISCYKASANKNAISKFAFWMTPCFITNFFFCSVFGNESMLNRGSSKMQIHRLHFFCRCLLCTLFSFLFAIYLCTECTEISLAFMFHGGRIFYFYQIQWTRKCACFEVLSRHSILNIWSTLTSHWVNHNV